MNFLKNFLRLIWGLITGFLIVVFGLILLVMIGFWTFQYWSNKTYATRLFEGYVDFDRVLASSRKPFHQTGHDGWYCSYAVVDLSENAPQTPPPGLPALDPDFEDLLTPGDWLPTPDSDLTRSYLNSPTYACRTALGETLTDRMSDAATTQGGWTMAVKSGDWYVYSKPAGLAYRLRVSN